MGNVTVKGQVTIPKAVRDHLGLKPGSEVRFRRASDGSIVLEAATKPARPDRFEALRGHAGKGLSTDDIMALTRGET